MTLPPGEGDRNFLIERQESHHLAGVSNAEDGPRCGLTRDSMGTIEMAILMVSFHNFSPTPKHRKLSSKADQLKQVIVMLDMLDARTYLWG
jgi:hypothetical protein